MTTPTIRIPIPIMPMANNEVKSLGISVPVGVVGVVGLVGIEDEGR